MICFLARIYYWSVMILTTLDNRQSSGEVWASNNGSERVLKKPIKKHPLVKPTKAALLASSIASTEHNNKNSIIP
jgi:hypothetical protein